MEVLLMTGTIKPLCNIKYNDVETRYSEYKTNIKKYISNSDFDVVVFAENSGYPFEYEEIEKAAKENSKIFEYLDLSAYAEKANMSVGDARIIEKAIEKSKYLNKNATIWKVSGRIYIENINTIIRTSAKDRNVFLYAKRYDAMQTWLFKAGVEELKKYFLKNDVFEEMSNSCIEYAWKHCWDRHRDDITLQRFHVYPDAKGVNSSGNPYTASSIKWILKNLFLKFGRYTVK